MPSAWDFPQVSPARFRLPEVRVGTWGGFVFVNPDPDCGPLEDFIGELPTFFERWPLEDRYTRVHVSKVLRVNWKVAQEAFMESFHVITTHPQLLPGFGDANSPVRRVRQRVAGHLGARRAQPVPVLGPDEQQRLNSQIDQRMDDPPMLEVPEGSTARQTLAEAARRSLRSASSATRCDDADRRGTRRQLLPDGLPEHAPVGRLQPDHLPLPAERRRSPELHHGGAVAVAVHRASGRRRPPEVRLGADEPWRTAVEQLGSLARVFDQDEFNLEAVQKGLRTTRKPGVSFGVYQESKIRHFHHLFDQWLDLEVTQPGPSLDG